MFTNLGNSIPRNGLVGEWLLDGNANDTGGTNNGTATNVTYVKTTKGYQSQAGSFNGSSSYINIPDNSNLDFGTGDFTVSFWLRLNNTNIGQYIINKWNNTGPNNGWIIQTDWTDGTKCTFYSYDGGTSSLTSGVGFFEANKWIKYTFVRNSTGIFMYKNGVLFSSNTSTPRNMDNPFPLLIGQVQNGQWTNGQIQGVRLYNRILLQDEIQLLYLEGLKLLGPTSIASYPKLFEGLVYYSDFKGTAHNLVDGVLATNSNVTTGTDHLGNTGILNTYNGTTSKIDLPTTTSISTYSFGAWIKTSTTGKQIIGLGNAGNTTVPYMELKATTGLLTLGTWNGSTSSRVEGTTNIADGNWHLCVVTKNGTTGKVYVDGILQTTGTCNNISTGTDRWSIGYDRINNVNFHNGQIDNVLVFNRELSADEVKLLYNLTSQDYIYPNTSYDLPSLRDGLILDLNEQGKDLSGNGNNGTLVNTPTVIRQGKAKGLSYNGSNQYLTIPTASSISLQTLTISAWVYPTTTTGNQQIIRKDTSGTRHLRGFTIDNGSQKIFAELYNGTLYRPSGYTFTNNQWIYIAMTISGSGGVLKYYVNGIQVGNNTTVGTFTAPSSDLYIGRDVLSAGNYFNGKVIYPRIRNKVLTQVELLQEYYSQKGNFIY